MRRLLPILLLAACYRADDLQSGKLHCAGDQCPEGYFCGAGLCWKDGTIPDDLSTLPDLSTATDLSLPMDQSVDQSIDLAVDAAREPDLREPDLLVQDDFDVGDLPNPDFTVVDLEEPDLRKFDLAEPDLIDASVAVVAAPQLTGTNPASPSSNNSPTVSGTAPPNATIHFYLGTCGTTLLGTTVANGAGAFSDAIPVAIDANDSIVADAVVGGVTSPCSSPLLYVEDQTKPGLAGNVQGTRGNGAVTLTWNPASDDRSGVASYEVSCNGTGCPPTVTGITTLSTTITGLSNCVTYTFTVAARDNAGNLGDSSSNAMATPRLPSPSPITWVTGPAIVEYSFPPVPNATNYVICHNTNTNACGGGTNFATTQSSGWVFGVASDGPSATVKLAVIAKDDNGCSSFASADSSQPVPTYFNKYTSSGAAGAGEGLGNALTMLGDLDGDGFPEYLAGANTARAQAGSSESAWVFSTKNNGAEMCHAVGVPGGQVRNHDYFGSAVAGGDVNGDGKADLIVGAPLYGPDFTSTNLGRVWLFDGATCTTAPPTYNPFRTNDGAAGDQLGSSVAFLGDLNGDGKGEYAAGAPGSQYVAVYNGATGGAFYPNITSTGQQFGKSLAAVGDLDLDGYNDLVVGAPLANGFQGELFVYSGKTGAPIGSPINGSGTEHLGVQVAGVGDVNGDGVPDFAAVTSTQVVRIYSGASFQVLWTKTGTQVAAMGDIDRDGRADYAVLNNGLTMFSGFDGNFLFSFGTPSSPTALAYGGHMTDGNAIGLLVGAPGANGNDGEARVFVIGNGLLQITHGEFIDPFGLGGWGGYGAGDTHSVAPGNTQFFSHYGGTDPATWAIVTNGSGGFLTGAGDPNYHPGPTTPRFDLVRVTDSLNRSVDTRVLAADAVAPSPSPLARPAPLDATPVSSSRIDLSWMNAGGATQFTVEYRQATQAWVRFGTTGATTAQVTGLSPNTNYAFRVQGTLASGGMSLWSRTVYGSTQ